MTFAGQASAAPYILVVNFTETSAEAQRIRSVEEVVEIVDGPLFAGQSRVHDDMSVDGELSVDEVAQSARATVRVCRRNGADCERLIGPTLTFRVGDEARWFVSGLGGSYLISLTPVTE
jgi:hypothetical protein